MLLAVAASEFGSSDVDMKAIAPANQFLRDEIKTFVGQFAQAVAENPDNKKQMTTISFEGDNAAFLPMARRLNLWHPLTAQAEPLKAGGGESESPRAQAVVYARLLMLRPGDFEGDHGYDDMR